MYNVHFTVFGLAIASAVAPRAVTNIPGAAVYIVVYIFFFSRTNTLLMNVISKHIRYIIHTDTHSTTNRQQRSNSMSAVKSTHTATSRVFFIVVDGKYMPKGPSNRFFFHFLSLWLSRGVKVR